jgi:hypothetical protein
VNEHRKAPATSAEVVQRTKDDIEHQTGGLSPLARLMQGRELPHVLVTLPGFEGEEDDGARVALVALTDHSFTEARLAAQAWLTKKGLPDHMLQSEMGQAMLDNEVQTQCLHFALRQPKMLTARYTASANEVRGYFEPHVRLALWNELLSFTAARNPLQHASDEEVEELVALMGKDSSETELPALSFYDAVTLRSMCTALANRCRKLTRQLFSVTTSPNGAVPSSSLPDTDPSSSP